MVGLGRETASVLALPISLDTRRMRNTAVLPMSLDKVGIREAACLQELYVLALRSREEKDISLPVEIRGREYRGQDIGLHRDGALYPHKRALFNTAG